MLGSAIYIANVKFEIFHVKCHFYPRDAPHSAVLAVDRVVSVCLSVRLSVTRRYCV